MIIKAVATAFCGILAYSMLKTYKPEFAPLCELCSVALILFYAADELIDIKAFFENTAASAGISADCIKIPLKALGTALITQLAADTARDSGQSALASKIELTGRVVIIYCAVPVLKSIVSFVAELTQNM